MFKVELKSGNWAELACHCDVLDGTITQADYDRGDHISDVKLKAKKDDKCLSCKVYGIEWNNPCNPPADDPPPETIKQAFTNGSATYDAYCRCNPHPTRGYTALSDLRYLMDRHLSGVVADSCSTCHLCCMVTLEDREEIDRLELTGFYLAEEGTLVYTKPDPDALFPQCFEDPHRRYNGDELSKITEALSRCPAGEVKDGKA